MLFFGRDHKAFVDVRRVVFCYITVNKRTIQCLLDIPTNNTVEFNYSSEEDCSDAFETLSEMKFHNT